MAEWFPAQVAARADIGSALVHLTVEVGEEVARSFHTPGQYHQVRVGGLWNPYAIASAPHQPRFEYLVRRSTGTADALAALEPGAWLDVGLVEGPGFPLHRATGRDLVLIGTGTASAPLRSVLEAIAADRPSYGAVTALLGHHAPDEIPFTADLPRWHDARLTVLHTVSTPTADWAGLVGRVQRHLARVSHPGQVAFLCGQNSMVTEVRQWLETTGVDPGEVFLNLP